MKKLLYIMILFQGMLGAVAMAQGQADLVQARDGDGSEYVMLRGSVQDAEGQALAEREILLASVVRPFYYGSTKSKADGSFSFELPRMYGAYEFFLRPGFEEAEDVNITIYENTQTGLKAQVLGDTSLLDSTPFYGRADELIYPSGYIEMKNIEEFFFELVKDVGIATIDGEKQLIIYKKQALSGTPPLILLDNIPIPNDEQLLNLSSKRIERIELITETYIIGDLMYGGIVALYSGKKDFAGYKFAESSHFFNYRLLDD